MIAKNVNRFNIRHVSLDALVLLFVLVAINEVQTRLLFKFAFYAFV